MQCINKVAQYKHNVGNPVGYREYRKLLVRRLKIGEKLLDFLYKHVCQRGGNHLKRN
jgi:hypothetical protein